MKTYKVEIVRILHDWMQRNGVTEMPLPYSDTHCIPARRSAMLVMLEISDKFGNTDIPVMSLIGFAEVTDDDIEWARESLRDGKKI